MLPYRYEGIEAKEDTDDDDGDGALMGGEEEPLSGS